MKSKKNKTPGDSSSDRQRNDAMNKNGSTAREGKLPGEYPAGEDIMNRMNTKRVGIDVENFSRTIGTENLNISEPVVTEPNSIEDEPISRQGGLEDRNDHGGMEYPIPNDLGQGDEETLEPQDDNESDVTEEDLQALGSKDLSMDMGEDEELLKNRVWPVDMSGGDLDVPGSELDDENEAIGSEDEENNSYSLGGDAHEDNLEGK